ncbi:MAG: hypothetical protein OEV80_17195, partial [candidate division Zixibacteria bacterium]|nr:hypothetical protein [candidate division Zixibacteria bacterium]
GELYVAVSDDGGNTWDLPRDLTNARSPHCDSASGAVGRCQSEHWPSMARFGTNHTFGPSPVVIDPSGSYSGDWFLDVQYIDDADPGAITKDEGTWTSSDVRWFRMACVEPVPWSTLEPSWSELGFPAWIHHGATMDTQLVITNSGNWTTDFVFTIEEDSGTYSGWLTLSPELQGTVSCGTGMDNTVTGLVTVNAGGMVNDPGTVVHLGGRLIAVGNQMTSPDTLPINVWVMDTMHVPAWDTISTGCLALTVSNHGNFGNQGIGKVNMDFFDYGDCDDLEQPQDTIPGNSAVYLNDASPVICWRDQSETVHCNWSIFNDGFPSEHGFIPLGHADSVPFFYGMSCDSVPESLFVDDTYMSRFATHDTSIQIEQWWVHPDQSASQGANWIIQILRIKSADGQTHTGLNIGEAIDWDIPADSAVRNLSGFSASERMVYQQGAEYNDDYEECQENSDRYGGVALLNIKEDDGGTVTESPDPYGGWSGSNSLWVYPNEGFVPSELDSLMTARDGYVLSDSIYADLFSVMTFKSGYTLTPTRELWVFKCLITSRLGFAAFMATVQECQDWYVDNLKTPVCGCCMPPIRGNVDYDPDDQVTIADLVCFVDFMFFFACSMECFEESDLTGDGAIDISDLVWMVDFMFTGGPPPVACP